MSRQERALSDWPVVAALAIAASWTLLLAVYARSLVHNYYPIADEWALIANSDPRLTDPWTWLTSGFSGYFETDPSLSEPYANFLRPVVNLIYCLLGFVLEPVSRWRLCFNFAVIGACAGMTYLCAARSAGPRNRILEIALAASVPLMPAFLPSFIELTPYNAFDALAAAVCLLAYLAAQSNRDGLTVGLLTIAVFTKETALPVAAAVPAWFLLRNRSRLRENPTLGLRALWLAMPLGLWVVTRHLVFGSVASGTYTWTEGVVGSVTKIATLAPHWPMPSMAPGWRSLLSLVPLAVNAVLVVGSIAVVGARLRRRVAVDLAEACWLFSYGAMLLVGVAPRYGASVDVFLIVAVVRAHQAQILRPLTSMMVAAVAICVALSGFFVWKTFPDVERLMVGYFRVAKRYVETLERHPAGDTVVVLNDPVTWHSRLRWLTAVANVPATVVKAMDFSCPASPERLREPCNVSLRAGEGGRQFTFAEGCGLDFCGATLHPHTPVRRTLLDGVSIDLPAPAGNDESRPVWHEMTLTLERSDVFLVYFNPQTRDFEHVHVP